MKYRHFQPGFRMFTTDWAVIVIGLIASVVLWPITWWIGFVIVFVVAHFFLFCNVFRISRLLELVWSFVFVAAVIVAVSFRVPWAASIASSLAATLIVILVEMRKPSYHGILWRQINPALPQWWAENSAGLS